MPLLHTSVADALVLAIRAFKLPSYLEKVHALVCSVAVDWWWKHRTMQVEEAPAAGESGGKPCVDAGGIGGGDLAGLGLLQCVGGPDVVAQLTFSTAMLHWLMVATPR